ncbi:dTDP-4-dehydrorhamnose reductase [Rubricoccus marinus]|uniref:dTDP-4-dehydrorhamnose reductase n=1 Tax=Rubricoccus marinus TaxID=716817 RepID=A0A259TWJ9_9BACT|nr:dTDP-4-dehydrorhamnose reductase [Rubricoccus marinus]OZC01954.1 dTDP-4-dehydrorhamnose reductase [Rubricoccus marinus]
MRILVTGANGQVGHAVAALARQKQMDVRAFARADLDITDAQAVDRAVADASGAGPLALVNAAAYTAVDRAENDREAAFAVNRDGPAHLAEACARHGAALVHLSTDYVFDGAKGAPYTEDDAPAPLNVYGESKWAGEEAVRQRLERHAIVRTAWVFSARGHNFIRTMWRLAHEREELRVVADQTGHPTWAGHLAEAVVVLARGLASGGEAGTFHVAGTPSTSWYGLAEAVVAQARASGESAVASVQPIPSSEYPTPAARPPEVRLAMENVARAYGLGAFRWQDGVEAVARELMAASREG